MSEPTEKRGRMNEKDQQIEKLRRLCKKLKDHNKRLFDDYSQVCVDQMNLRRQLDAVGKEKEAVERRVEELEEQRGIQDDIQATHEKENQRLRSQLAEKERELDKKDRRYEKMDEGYSHQIASLSMEVERLEDELDEFRLLTTPGFVEAMGLIDKGLTKGKIEFAKMKKRTVLVEDPAPTEEHPVTAGGALAHAKKTRPTEAEVEKVATELRIGAEIVGTAWVILPERERERWYKAARLAIERGYRRKE